MCVRLMQLAFRIQIMLFSYVYLRGKNVYVSLFFCSLNKPGCWCEFSYFRLNRDDMTKQFELIHDINVVSCMVFGKRV